MICFHGTVSDSQKPTVHGKRMVEEEKIQGVAELNARNDEQEHNWRPPYLSQKIFFSLAKMNLYF